MLLTRLSGRSSVRLAAALLICSDLLAEIVSTIKSRQPASAGALLQLLSDHKHYQRLLELLNEKAPTRDEFGDSMKALENHVQTTRLDALIKKAEAAELSLEEKKTLQELIKKR